MRLTELAIIIAVLIVGVVGIWLLIGWFAILLGGVIGGICIAAVAAALISIWERLSPHKKGH